VTAGAEPPDMRRRNFQIMVGRLADEFRAWRRDAPDRVERLSPYSTESTPRMGDMTDEQIEHYARRISEHDAERSINMSNDALGRAKRRANEAA
jgi:hypothetical protein